MMFGFDDSFAMLDVTPVENFFINEYLPDAKGDYVKVYLYGLMHSYHATESMSLKQMAFDLSIGESDIESAFRYWERRHLVKRVKDNPPEYRYLNSKQQMMLRQNESEDQRKYQLFAEELYAAFGDRRRLDGKECALAYEWVEDLGLKQEVVLMLINQLILTKGPQFSFRAAQKDALQLVDEGVNTIEDAEEVLSRSKSIFEGTKAVLRRLGKRHSPSDDEMSLYKKWLYTWNFTPDAVLEACRETTKGTPSMAYLDGILQGIYRRSGSMGIRSKAEMDKTISNEKSKYDGLRKLLHVLGADTTRPTEAIDEMYKEMLALLPEEALLKVAQQTARYGGRLMELEQTVKYLASKGIHDNAGVTAYYAEHYAMMQKTAELLGKMGLGARPSARQTQSVKALIDSGVSDERLAEAAELSVGKSEPFQYFLKVVQNAREKPEYSHAAKAEDASPQYKKTGKTPREANYIQRSYTEEELSSFAKELLKEAQEIEIEE
ncbi:MAG: DnaD domain protein [Eubacteriales bacterium]|nr:DnaD domain protein [Eubacteriales bacterium]MDD3881936.1 DnaD domain protein [Eubacteriales bacterium]MDD4513823.1 DnaD domain protein [Eubacteriales bacterium]